MCIKTTITCLAAAGCILGASFAQAEERAETTLETMTVTAQKKEENVQDVPGSVSVINDIQIEDSGITSLKGFDDYVPNFDIFQTGGSISNQSMRGQSNLITNSMAIGIYIDDVPATYSYLGVFTGLVDIERIEILRGPQGNLYGMNSAGGVVNIITKKPGNTLTGKTTVGYGNYNAYYLNTAVSGPVIEDQLFVGISGMFNVRDSYIEEEGGKTHEERKGSGRFHLRWTPSDKTDILFTQKFDDYQNDYDSWVVPSYDDYKIKNRGLTEEDDVLDTSSSLRIEHNTDALKITSITAFIDNEKYTIAGKDYTSEGDNLKYRSMDLDNRKILQEVRLASVDDAESSFRWLLGAFYLDGENSSCFNMRKDTGTAAAPTGIYKENILDSTIQSTTFSLFGNGWYTLFDDLTVSAGLRYDYDERENDYYHDQYGTIAGDYNDSTSWSIFSPRFNMDYRASDSVMTYLSVAKGYKAGNYSQYAGDTAETGLYDPENIWSYEIGTKTNWLNNKLIANMSLFYSTVEDIQVFYMDSETYAWSFENAAEAEIWGAELEVVARPMPGLQVSGFLGLLESEFTEHQEKEYEGNTVPYAPKYNAGLTLQYAFNRGVYARCEAIWHGKTYFDSENEYGQDDYLIINSKIGYDMGNFSINLYAKNLLDETYYTFANYSSGVEKAVTGAPLTFGIQTTYRF